MLDSWRGIDRGIISSRWYSIWVLFTPGLLLYTNALFYTFRWIKKTEPSLRQSRPPCRGRGCRAPQKRTDTRPSAGGKGVRLSTLHYGVQLNTAESTCAATNHTKLLYFDQGLPQPHLLAAAEDRIRLLLIDSRVNDAQDSVGLVFAQQRPFNSEPDSYCEGLQASKQIQLSGWLQDVNNFIRHVLYSFSSLVWRS